MSVHQSTAGESSSHILSAAREQGFSVSDRQLKRWHHEGLIPKPDQSWTKGIPGSETIYPSGATDQLLALCRLRKRTRQARRLGWQLWWLGFPVAEKHWKDELRERADWYDKYLPLVTKAIELSFKAKPANNGLLSHLKSFRVRNIIFRQLRKRVGDERFGSFIFLVADILEGRFEGWRPVACDNDEDLVRDKITIDRALGLFRAPNKKRIEQQPTLYDDVADALVLISCRLSGPHLAELLAARSDAEIVGTRNSLRGLLATAGALKATGSEVRKLGLGLDVLAKFASGTMPTQQLLLLGLIALKEDSAFQHNCDRFIASFCNAVRSSVSPQQIAALGRLDPALACLFDPGKMRTDLS